MKIPKIKLWTPSWANEFRVALLALAVLSLVVAPNVSLATSNGDDDTLLSFYDARHLLVRTGFGASPVEIDKLMSLSRLDGIEYIMSGLSRKPSVNPPDWALQAAPQHWRFKEFSKSDKQKYQARRIREIQSLRRWWIEEMISTDFPQHERLVLFWHNHFPTSFTGINSQAIAIARQHMMFRKHATGKFGTLLKEIIRDPAMLNYLDNNRSNKIKPNENLAREILELFTLGEGSYTEEDVKNAARALTGYTYSEVYDHRFVFKHQNHDLKEKTIFGQAGSFDGDDLVDLILQQPGLAQFITAKLWRLLIGEVEIGSDKLSSHMQAFRQSDYDIAVLYRSLITSKDFWSIENRGSMIQSPVSLTIGSIRMTGFLPLGWQSLPSDIAQMGQNLFEPPNVAGWKGGGAWVVPGRLLVRMDWLKKLNKMTTVEERSEDHSQSRLMLMAAEDNRSADIVDFTAGKEERSEAAYHLENTPVGFNDKVLTVRLASEQFDGPVRYKITVHGKHAVIWGSAEMKLIGGHDSKNLGRINRRQMPWQLIEFPVDFNEGDVVAVEVEFLNDTNDKVASSRNLYVSELSLGKRMWLATDGQQTSKCIKEGSRAQGDLLCGGYLRIEKYTDVFPETTGLIASDVFRASGAYLGSVRKIGKNRVRSITFLLSDVEFDGRTWNTLRVRYVNDSEGYSINIDKYDCWPVCFTDLPDCFLKKNNVPGASIVSLPLLMNRKYCSYEHLDDRDKKLANALWSIADELHIAAAGSIKARHNKKLYEMWEPHVDNIYEKIEISEQFSNDVRLEIVQRPVIRPKLQKVNNTPLPAGISSLDRHAAWQKIMNREPDIDLVALLLPGAPTRSFSSSEKSVEVISSDLVFQLR